MVSRPRPDGGGEYTAFVPNPLPPSDAIQTLAKDELGGLLADAEHWLGQLIGIGVALPNPDLLIRPYMRQEAVESSQIEGTRTSFSELVAYEVEAEVPPGSDVRDVYNYLTALQNGLRAVHQGEEISADLIRRLHRTLMSGARGEALSRPGEFRAVQNHVGPNGTNDPAEAKFVPPPPPEMLAAMDSLFAFVNGGGSQIPLMDLAWIHYQFEAIHPFQDGNGRVGRILIPLCLAQRRNLQHPLLYLSPYFQRNQSRYYEALFETSSRSTWIPWLKFFLEGVVEQAKLSVDTAGKVIAMGDEWRQRLEMVDAPPNALRLAQRVHQKYSALNARLARISLEENGQGVTMPTVYKAIQILEQVGILAEVTGRDRNRVWVATDLTLLLDSRNARRRATGGAARAY